MPVEIAVGSRDDPAGPDRRGPLPNITGDKSIRADYATERLTARRIDEAEADALDVPADESVLSVVITAHQSSGAPILTSGIVMPGSRHEIEDSYPLSRVD